jgi:ribosomal protein S27AE
MQQGDVAVQIRAVGIVVRRALRATCPRCDGALGPGDAVGGRATGVYPRPPLGTAGYLCGGCGHVEYVRDRRLRTRAALASVRWAARAWRRLRRPLWR